MSMSFFDAAIKEVYAAKLAMQLDFRRSLFWDGTHGPPDPRPFYGPPEPPDTACGDMHCRCCAHWRDQWENHCC